MTTRDGQHGGFAIHRAPAPGQGATLIHGSDAGAPAGTSPRLRVRGSEKERAPILFAGSSVGLGCTTLTPLPFRHPAIQFVIDIAAALVAFLFVSVTAIGLVAAGFLMFLCELR